MGCAACTQMCGSQKDSPKVNNEFLQIVQQKVMFLRKTFSKPEQKKFLNEYFFEDQMNIILHLMSFQKVLRPQQILLPEAGQLAYLSPTRRTLWKLYSFDTLVFQYTKNPIIPPFTQDLSTIKLSQKAEQRFYEINLDINRTFPLIKHLKRDDLSLVLKNLTLYFDGVGYTQGMNFVVGFLLLCGFQARQAYWMFIHLSFNQNFLLIRNFSEGFKNTLFMIKIFEDYMEQHKTLGKIKSKVDEMGLTSFFYSFSWFLCYFLYSLDPKCCVLIWDYLLTFDLRKLSIGRDVNLQMSGKNRIEERSQLQIVMKQKRQVSPQYFEIILNRRGSILNIIYLAFELMQYLSEHIHESQSAEELMKILRNQSLIEKITPDLIEKMIEKIRNGNDLEQSQETKLNWEFLVNKMQSQDPQLYQIQITQDGHIKFVQECIGLRRSGSNKKNNKNKEIKVEPKTQN